MYIYKPYTVPKKQCRCNSELYTDGLSATAQLPAVTWLQPPVSICFYKAGSSWSHLAGEPELRSLPVHLPWSFCS